MMMMMMMTTTTTTRKHDHDDEDYYNNGKGNITKPDSCAAYMRKSINNSVRSSKPLHVFKPSIYAAILSNEYIPIIHFQENYFRSTNMSLLYCLK
jgi:hypothetical protein